jgi:2',3'-cyclic-nucleotide 2'-phosphodiesterase (5'-nucleotidase family)
VVDQIRKEEGSDHVVLIHAGDEFSRGDELTTQTQGAANIALMNQIGFNLWTPGNGEFYSGAANLQQRISEAHFPTLAANISYRLSGEHLAQDTCSLTVQGVHLGFLGLCFIHKEHPSSFVLKREDPVETAKRVVPELRKKSDLVISVDHIGLTEDQRVASSVPGIDLIIGGHSHTVLPKGTYTRNPEDRQVLIVQAGYHLHYLGRVDLDLEHTAEGWQLRSAKARLISLDSHIPQDPAIKATIAKLSEKLTTHPTTAPTTPQPAGVD